MKVVITREAEADFERIADYIARDNPRRAVSFVRELSDVCRKLGDMPLRFASVPRHEASGVRRCPHGSYLIFYRVKDEEVEVLHILHGAQDHETILFPEP